MLHIIKADERVKRSGHVKMAIFGPSGVGKTTQARTLPSSTLFIDLEAGTLALGQEWCGDVIDIRQTALDMQAHPWELARAIALWIGGPDPSDANGNYSMAAYNAVVEAFGPPETHAKYDTVFVDSITVASRECLKWAQTQPDAFSEKTGRPDMRGAYGLLGREMMRWLTHLQHTPKSIIVVGILNEELDDLKRKTFVPQIDGAKTGNELPGIFDEVLTLQTLDGADKVPYRAFVCHQTNPWGFPAKDRSGTLDMIEPPDLGALLLKIKNGVRVDAIETNLKPSNPDPVAPEPAEQPTETPETAPTKPKSKSIK
jgi:hypothetical protein